MCKNEQVLKMIGLKVSEKKTILIGSPNWLAPQMHNLTNQTHQ